MSEIKENFDEKEFLEKVEKAAEEGARKGYRASLGTEFVKVIFTKIVIPALVIMAVMMFILPKASFTGFKNIFNARCALAKKYLQKDYSLLGGKSLNEQFSTRDIR